MKAKPKPIRPPEKKPVGRPRKAETTSGTAAGLKYSLEKIHGIWRATIRLPSGTVREYSLGTPDIAAAHREAKLKAAQVASGLRWAEKQNQKKPAAPPPTPAPPPPSPPAPPPASAPPPPPPPPPPPAAAAAPPEKRAEDIAARLRSIGDQIPIQPDGIFPGGPENDPDDEEAAAADAQADELFADTVAAFAVMATLAIPKRILASRRPPKRPGPPDPWSLQAYTQGLQLGARKLMGAASLGPVAKTLAGAVGIMLSMFIGAEPMSQPATPAAAASSPQPAPSPPAPPAPAPYSDDETALATSNGFSSVGTFR